jgi:predicted ArsR family transcriptional regulator
MDSNSELERRIAAVAALDQPLRRDLYRALNGAPGWTTRDAAAEALGIPRSVAAFHLDRLADVGVVDVRFERVGGRTGPGAGRPSKLYRPAGAEVIASVPDRHYDLAGSLLAEAVAESVNTGAPVRDCLRDAARATGRQVAQRTRAASATAAPADRRAEVIGVLASYGYEPLIGDDDEAIALANCPFHSLADQQRELVCGMNLDFLAGVLEGIGPDDRLTARLDPAPGYCCVRIMVN